LLEGVAELPAGLETWFCYDPRVDAYRAPANRYNDIIGPLKGELARNKAPRYQRRELSLRAGDDALPASTRSARGLASRQGARRGGIADRSRKNPGRVAGAVLGAARRLIMVPTSGFDAAMVRAAAGGVP
jgi:hypothetical protein